MKSSGIAALFILPACAGALHLDSVQEAVPDEDRMGSRFHDEGTSLDHKIVYGGWKSNSLKQRIINEEYRKADLMNEILHIHHGRNKNCESYPDKGFPFQAHSDSLRKPRTEDWLHTLRGKRTVFFGDSVLRDFFLAIVRSLIDHMQTHSSKNQWKEYGFGRDKVGRTIEAQFSENVTLQFWWAPAILRAHEDHSDPELSDDNVKYLASADLVIFNMGAHYSDQGDLMAAISRYWDQALKQASAKRGLVWMQYPAPHFPWGLGEFEDPQRVPSACSPAGDDVSPVSSVRLSADRFFKDKGVPILELWNASRPLWNNHPPSRENGGSEYNGAIDCRHWCSPGLNLYVWQRLLYTLLQSL